MPGFLEAQRDVRLRVAARTGCGDGDVYYPTLLPRQGTNGSMVDEQQRRHLKSREGWAVFLYFRFAIHHLRPFSTSLPEREADLPPCAVTGIEKIFASPWNVRGLPGATNVPIDPPNVLVECVYSRVGLEGYSAKQRIEAELSWTTTSGG